MAADALAGDADAARRSCQYVVMHGESMRYRKALIRHCQLVNQLDPEEYPDGNAQ